MLPTILSPSFIPGNSENMHVAPYPLEVRRAARSISLNTRTTRASNKVPLFRSKSARIEENCTKASRIEKRTSSPFLTTAPSMQSPPNR